MSTQTVRPSAPVAIPSRVDTAVTAELEYAATMSLKHGMDWRKSLESFRQAIVRGALAECNGVQKHAAARLGITRAALAAHIKRGKELL